MSCPILNIPPDGIFSGSSLFLLKSTYGFPMEIAIDKIINEHKCDVSWADFIEEARKNKWYDYQIYGCIVHALEDAGVDRDYQSEVKTRLQSYIIDGIEK